MKVKVGDSVMIITGKEKGKKGEVIRILPKSSRVVVQNLNMVTKHRKKTREQAGERFEKEASLHVSNVMVISPETSKPTRVRYEISKDGKKYRMAIKGGASLDKPFVKS